MRNNLCQLYFIYILFWLYLDVQFQEQTNFKLHSMVSDISLSFVVCKWLLLWQRQNCGNNSHSQVISIFSCQVSKTCKHICFPIIAKFKEIYNKKRRKVQTFTLFWPIKRTHRENINKSLCLFLREVKNICDNTLHLREYIIRSIFCCVIRIFYEMDRTCCIRYSDEWEVKLSFRKSESRMTHW